jgi:hypothetical protein
MSLIESRQLPVVASALVAMPRAAMLKGAHRSDLWIERSSKYTLAIHLSAAPEFRIVIPQTLILQADSAIEQM